MIRRYSGDIKTLQDLLVPIAERTVGRDLSKNPGRLLKGYTTAYYSNPKGREIHKMSELKDLTDFVLDIAEEYIKENNLSNEKPRIVTSWFNIYPPGTYIEPHSHVTVPNLLSSVFYLKSDDNSGTLYLKDDPQPKALKQGEVFIFPSTIEHWTTPNMSSTDRIVYGCDIYYGTLSDEILARRVASRFDIAMT
jgi:hypothetical protein